MTPPMQSNQQPEPSAKDLSLWAKLYGIANSGYDVRFEQGPSLIAAHVAAATATARAALAQEVKDGNRLRELLEQMLNVAENADETGYVTDCGFVDLDELHAEVRAAIK